MVIDFQAQQYDSHFGKMAILGVIMGIALEKL